jgi:hypothetical protein
MKPPINSIIIILLSSVFFLLYFSLTSCKKVIDPNTNYNEKDTITYDLLKTSVYVQFVDALTNEYIIPEIGEDIKVRIIGKSKDAVVDIIGLQKDEYIAKEGFITFGLLSDAEFTPSPASPINFTIIAKLPNYITSKKDVTLTNEGDYMVKIFMVNVDYPPPGVKIAKIYNAGVLINGVLQEDISISTQNQEAWLNIPGGTQLFKSDSTHLAGKLNITLAYYSGIEDKSLAAMPGGIVGNVLENGSINSGVFFSSGMLSFEITDSDWQIASFIENKNIEIGMLISEQSYNPVTSSNIIDGDIIPFYSYSADTGMWVFQQETDITNQQGELYTTVETQELDCVNFSWFETNNCDQGSKFQIAGGCTQCKSVMVEGEVRKQIDNTFVSNIIVAGDWDEPANIPFSVGTTPVYINWNQNNDCNYCFVDPASSPLLIDDMCSQQIIELPLSDNSPVSMSITAYFSGLCPSDTNVLILPSFGIWIRPVDATCWRWSSMKNGVAQICNVVYGETYVLGTYYNGIWKEWEIEISEETIYYFKIDFSQTVCTDVFGIF